ncbi:hypothetical protein [Pseudomonas protegens]|uniref:hypothetical protein n=1 Tax=Pseudomonas protegens TaxID=380021 RepID=UPI00223B19B4|nr:hypothetical protein [Pseudomonas protegens]
MEVAHLQPLLTVVLVAERAEAPEEAPEAEQVVVPAEAPEAERAVVPVVEQVAPPAPW